MCTVVFLDINGEEMVDVDQDRAYELVLEVAAGKTEDIALIAGALRSLRADV